MTCVRICESTNCATVTPKIFMATNELGMQGKQMRTWTLYTAEDRNVTDGRKGWVHGAWRPNDDGDSEAEKGWEGEIKAPCDLKKHDRIR